MLFMLCQIFSGKENSLGQWRGTNQIENGVTVINNPREPLWGKFKLDLREDMAIGNENDPQYLFWSVKDIAIDVNGNVCVLDMRNHRIQRFDTRGKYLQSIGRHGQGPGEFQLPTIVRINDRSGNIYVKDYIYSIVVFNKHGEHIKRLTLSDSIDDFIVDDNEDFVAILEKPDPVTLSATQVLCKISPQGEVAEIYGEFPRPIYMNNSAGRGTSMITTGYESSLYIAKLDEKAFVYGYSKKYELFIADWSGNVLFKIKRNLSPPGFTRKERHALKKFRDLKSTPLEQKPYFFMIMCDSRGRIYVQKNLPRQMFAGKGAVDISGKEVDVFSKDGYFLYETWLPANTFVIKEGFLYAYEMNEETGLESIKRFKINNWEQMKE